MKKLQVLAAVVFFLGFTALISNWKLSGFLFQNKRESHVSEPAGKYVFAVSWQPAFCETRPNRPECRSQHQNRFDANNFSLHGLWPQPVGRTYCNVDEQLKKIDRSGGWKKLPKLNLSERLRAELEVKMPGYRSFLHRHEWYKHGTCIPGFTPEKYFRVSLKILDQINDSKLAQIFRSSPGKKFTFRDISELVDESFGTGASKRVEMDCFRKRGRRMIGQLEFSLAGEIGDDRALPATLLSGDVEGRSCPSGEVDRVGLQ